MTRDESKESVWLFEPPWDPDKLPADLCPQIHNLSESRKRLVDVLAKELKLKTSGKQMLATLQKAGVI